MGFFTRGVVRAGWRLSPQTMVLVEELRTSRIEVSQLREEVDRLRREVDEARRDSLRIAELTDLVVDTLSKLPKTESSGTVS